ncbi:MAG: glycosyltransferase [Planctomycetes bacterium]|nr:glycosyltransferase [Planctomycetota bacterium]
MKSSRKPCRSTVSKEVPAGSSAKSEARAITESRQILMLGWAFPAHLSGGVGTACQGLCRALGRAGVAIDFVMSSPDEGCVPEGVDALALVGSPKASLDKAGSSSQTQFCDSWDSADQHARALAQQSPTTTRGSQSRGTPAPFAFVRIGVSLDPYQRPASSDPVAHKVSPADPLPFPVREGQRSEPLVFQAADANRFGEVNEADFFAEVDCYTHQAIQAASARTFDVIHAHDWMTFQAAAAIAQSSERPFVAHVHSTEYERTVNHVHDRIFEIERRAFHAADAVIAVSHMARDVLIRRYDVPAEKISVVYNAVDRPKSMGSNVPPNIVRDEKIVLFMGRMTLQKGPEYFLAAARKVLEVVSPVRFIMAGTGELLEQTMALADQLGIADHVIFPGLLRGDEVERMFRSADLYVMPSVSDPFGIAALEAASFDVPVLVSRQSGVSEVLRHVLKTDFWDIDDMADKMAAVLKHPPLQAALRTHAGFEVRRLNWADAACRVMDVYQAVSKNPSMSVQRGGET